jgi:hypothetical protein
MHIGTNAAAVADIPAHLMADYERGLDLVKTLRKESKNQTLSKKAKLAALTLSLAYSVALSNNGDNAKSLSDKDFAFAMQEIGDSRAWKAFPETVTTTMVTLIQRKQQTKYASYVSSAPSFTDTNLSGYYIPLANEVGRIRAELIGQHFNKIYGTPTDTSQFEGTSNVGADDFDDIDIPSIWQSNTPDTDNTPNPTGNNNATGTN